MFIQRKDQQLVIIGLMVSTIVFLNYFTLYISHDEHCLYRVLFYLPLVLGTLWFALKGAAIISASVIFLLLPYAAQHWDGFSTGDVYAICEALVYVSVALILGYQVQRAGKERQALVEAERLSAIGRTVVEVAHDMRAPLVVIGGLTDQIARKLDDRDPNKKKLDIVVKETAHLDRLVREMLEFGRTLKLELVETSLNDVVSEALEVARTSATVQGVELALDLAQRMPRLLLDPYRLKQVIVNLITNAVQASSRGDRVKVSTYVTELGSISLDVVDAGCGIEKKDQEKIFLPFFTTKSKGTGLGLAIVKKIVEAHGGELHFSSNRGRGVTFRVQIPAIPMG